MEESQRYEIITHGYHRNPDSVVYLRLIDKGDQIEHTVGSWAGVGRVSLVRFNTSRYDKWTHVAGVHDGAAWRLYLSGELAASAPSSQGAVRNPESWAIGAHPSSQHYPFFGDIDDVRIYGRALTAEEVHRLWKSSAE